MLNIICDNIKIFLRHYGSHLLVSWRTSWPMIVIMAFEFIISLTDVYIAGRYGKEYQAAVGVVIQIYFIFIVMANALTVGAVSIMSKLHTSKENRDELDTVVSSAMRAVFLAGTAICILGFFGAQSIMSILSVPERVRELGAPLFRVYALGIIGHYILINTNGILRSTGRVTKSMTTMAVACATNVLINLCIYHFTGIGYIGIAVSTAASVALAALINLYRLRSNVMSASRFSISAVKAVANIGWPVALLQVLWQFGGTVLFMIVASLPRDNIVQMAALTNGLRIEAAIFLPAFAFNMANAVVVGNSIGEGERDDAFKGGLVTAGLSVALVSLITLIIALNARMLFNFTSGNARVVEESMRYIYIVMWSEPIMAWATAVTGGLNGAGDTRGSFMVVASSIWFVRVPFAYFLGIVLGLGPAAIWWSMNASILAHAVFITRRWMRRAW